MVAVLVAAPLMARPAQALTCSASEITSSVAYFQEKMSVETTGGSSVDYVHRDDPRITAKFLTSLVPPPPTGTSRQIFAGRIQNQINTYARAGYGRTGAEVAVDPYDPVQWRIFSRYDGRLVGEYGIYVSENCVLTAIITAPVVDQSKGDTFKRRWNDLVSAMELVRVSAGRMGEPIQFAQDDLSPKGWRAYIIGVALPLVAAAILFFIFGPLVTIGQPSLLARLASGAIAFCAMCVLAGTLIERAEVLVPDEMRVLVAIVALVGTLGALWHLRWATLGAICIAVGTGVTLSAYAFFGWTPGILVAYGLAGLIILCALMGVLTWGSSRTEFAEA
ncbi:MULTISPECIES: hypothetical protein [unclassified Bradyrhizobium]